MNANSKQFTSQIRIILVFLITISAVISLSLVLRAIWTIPKEELPDIDSLRLTADYKVSQVIGAVKQLMPDDPDIAPKLVAKSLKVKLPDKANASLSELGIDPDEARTAIGRTLALKAERESKDFKKIFLKFGLWIGLLIIPLVILTRRRLTPKFRMVMLGCAVLLFGVILGSDPSPMGTVKDAVVLLGIHKAVFAPRMIALGVFLLIVVIANKFICSWGCQFGTLQEFIYRINHHDHSKHSSMPVVKLPFALTNTIRVIIFTALTTSAFVWAFDLIGPVDPFKIFKPQAMGIIGIVFVAMLLLASLFIYRPWCSLFCPFGLVSWLFEKLSFWKVRVDYGKCTACNSCTRACPSDAMKGILHGRAMPADCFSCGDCLDACPTEAVQFTRPGVVKPDPRRTEILAKLKG